MCTWLLITIQNFLIKDGKHFSTFTQNVNYPFKDSSKTANSILFEFLDSAKEKHQNMPMKTNQNHKNFQMTAVKNP